MKKIKLIQYVEARRTVEMEVPDGTTEEEAATFLNAMSLNNTQLPDSVSVVFDWAFVSHRGIENGDGKELIPAE